MVKIINKCIKFIQNEILPETWVSREITPDYGIDLDVELFDYENDRCITLGEHIFLQVKGTESPTYGNYTGAHRTGIQSGSDHHRAQRHLQN